MSLVMKIVAVAVVGGFVVEPAMARSAVALASSSDLSLIGLGLFGVILGQRGGRKQA